MNRLQFYLRTHFISEFLPLRFGFLVKLTLSNSSVTHTTHKFLAIVEVINPRLSSFQVRLSLINSAIELAKIMSKSMAENEDWNYIHFIPN